MWKLLFVLLLMASPAVGQDLTAAGCGSNDVQFKVKTDKKQHPTGQVPDGKALVYVINDSGWDNVAVHIGTPPERFGVDGKWTGANGYKGYFFFSVDPGEHQLCTNGQSKLKTAVKNLSAATTFTAEPGKSYYFRTKTAVNTPGEQMRLVPVDPAEAQVLIANSAYSTFKLKK